MANIVHWGITDGLRLARILGEELNDRAKSTPEEFIAAGEHVLLNHPEEWVLLYALADKYQELGYYTEGLRMAQKCVEVRPNDIRSAYLLATAYNLITRAAWSDREEEAAELLKMIWGSSDAMDKRLSQGALDRTGLTVETAAVQAIRWFEKALTLNPDRQSLAQIQMDLEGLYLRFPQLQR